MSCCSGSTSGSKPSDESEASPKFVPHYDSDESDYGDGVPNMTEEQFRVYYRYLEESEGFDVPDFGDAFAFGIIIPFMKPGVKGFHKKSLQNLNLYSSKAIELFNRIEDTNYEFVKVVKANSEVVGGFMYYITFEAEDKSVGHVEPFEAKVFSGIQVDDIDVLICRRKKNVPVLNEGPN